MSIVAVAKRAGVSVATVSRVINDLGSVRSKTADQVREAMRAIGYTPPVIRRGPKLRRTEAKQFTLKQIAILNVGGGPDWLHLPVMGSVVSGVVRACKEQGIRPILDEMPDPSQLSNFIRDGEVDGAIVFLHSGASDTCLEQIRQHMPLVRVTGGEGTTTACDHVAAHNAAIGQMAFAYLRRNGSARTAFVTDRPELQLMRMRGVNFNSAAVDACIPNHTYIVSNNSATTRAYAGTTSVHASLHDVVEQIAASPLSIDGLFIPTDHLTSVLYPMFERVGIRIGRELKVISCDNERVRLTALTPRPPSIDLRSDEIGRMAVSTLQSRIANPNQPRISVLVNPTLDADGPEGAA